MQAERPDRLVDPVCGMAVRVAVAEEDGLLVELDGRTYAFCRAQCRDAFVASPERYADQAATSAVAPASGNLPVIDEGIRRWYESCSCCLSDVYPEIKAQLDAERAAAAETPAGAGICEVAEAGEHVAATH
ncbi:hypothetical protein BH23CHL7_BH23CHL7_08050 [soil metagenome]